MANLSNINGKFVVEQTTGYVGVGTTDPNYPIEVLNASAEIALNASGASIYRLRSDSTDAFRINKNGVGDRLVIDGGGDATFAGMITVNGGGIDIDNDDDIRLRFDNASTFYAGLEVATAVGNMITNSAINDFAIRSQTNMLFAAGGATERMRINSSGDVLMGNTVVNPASNFSNQKGFGYKFSTGQTEIATTSDVDTLTLGRNIAADGNILVLRKQANVIGVFGSNTAGGDPLLDIASAPGESSLMRFLTSGSERMRITAAGAIEIKGAGTTVNGNAFITNTNALTTFGSTQSSGVPKDMAFFNGSIRMTIQATTGNVGIENTSPGAKLDVGVTIHPNTTGIDVAAGTGGGNCIGLTTVNNHNWFPYTDGNNYYSAAKHQFRGGANNAPNYMMLDSVGLGIGTTSPDFALDIEAVSSGVQLQMGRITTNAGSAWMGASGSGFALGVGAYGAGNSTTDPVGFIIDASGNLSTKRRIQARSDSNVSVSITRNLFVSWGGASYAYTFDPVAVFGANKSGGTLKLRVSGWPTRLFEGIIIWRNDGGGSSKIGTGVVTLVTIATNDFSGVGVSVSLPSSNTNEIRIDFSGWHSNDHGWSCYIKNDF